MNGGIIKKFSKYLTAIEYPKKETTWNIAGILKGQNAFHKFDVRKMFEMPKMALQHKKDDLILELKKWLLNVKKIGYFRFRRTS